MKSSGKLCLLSDEEVGEAFGSSMCASHFGTVNGKRSLYRTGNSMD